MTAKKDAGDHANRDNSPVRKRNTQRKRNLLRKIFPSSLLSHIKHPSIFGIVVIILTVIAVALASIAYNSITGGQLSNTVSDIGDAGRVSQAQNRNHKVLPGRQDISCPAVELIAVPGSWEISNTDNPYHPRFNPHSLLLNITTPLSRQYPHSRVEVYTVPYIAQLRNPQNLADRTYNDSRAQGQEKTEKRLREINTRCPLTQFIIIGFSQGAVIVGDVANKIGLQYQPIDPDRVAFVGLISDPRRVHGKSFNIGPDPVGDGIEVSFAGFNTQNLEKDSSPLQLDSFLGIDGITLRGARENDFGELDHKTAEICAQNDIICDAPSINLHNPLNLITQLLGALQPVHNSYANTGHWNMGGKSALVWLRDKIVTVIEQIPTPRH